MTMGNTGARSGKAPTGIEGLDQITHGGLPRGRTTLVGGGPGSGKTILALQTLVHAATQLEEPGIFVAFEESRARLLANSDSFIWSPIGVDESQLYFLDARPDYDLIQSGDFELSGLLASIEAKAEAMGARRVALDGIDALLCLFEGPRVVRRELYRLHDWLVSRDLTAMVTLKAMPAQQDPRPLDLHFLEFMVDCTVHLRHDLINGISQRTLQVSKYRGASFEENAAPVVIARSGLEVAYAKNHSAQPASTERITSGIPRLDTMLGGGYYRGSSILLTGAPGTCKTTLAGAFAQAACERGERTLFISFDSRAEEVIRNLASVGLRLGEFVDQGLLHLISARSIRGSAETHFLRIRELGQEHGIECAVIDPVSALAQSVHSAGSQSVAERLIDWARSTGVTLLCTSLLDRLSHDTEGTAFQISTLADTWIQLSYLVHSGERNRGLSIIKSRGTSHSNQVRELILSSEGIALADVYTAGGEVLMGSLRFEKEREERLARTSREHRLERARELLALETTELALRLESVKLDLLGKQKELEEMELAGVATHNEGALARNELRRHRRADAEAVDAPQR